MADIYIISMGVGSRDYLTPIAKSALDECNLLIGSDKFRELYPEYTITVPNKIISGTLEMIEQNRDKKIGVMVTGDAGFYSLAKSVVKKFGRDSVKIFTGISIVQAAFALICEPWEDAKFISAHGRDIDLESINDDKILILCDSKNTACNIAKKLLNKTERYDLYVFENIGMQEENVIYINEKNDLQKISNASLSSVAAIRREDG